MESPALLFLVTLVAALSIRTGEGSEKVIDKSDLDTRVKVLGQSGKFMMAPNDGHPLTSSPDLVTMEMDSVTELDENGDAITGGSVKHSFNTFASQDFTIGELRAETLQELDCEFMQFDANLAGGATNLKVGIYIFKEAGDVVYDGEKQTVAVGTVKWSVLLKDWNWCDSCQIGGTTYNGDNVDFTISVLGREEAKPESSGADGTEDYKIGALARLKLSKKYRVGLTWKDMAAGYPKVETQGARTMFTLRFKRDDSHDNEFFYDPSVTFGAGSRVLLSSMCLVVCLISRFL